MAYVALYRKYRSQSFGELMGQEAVTTTLQNAIKTGRIAHAYLFFGARGCGKTSTARLLARALNCTAHDGPTPEPCGVCRLCVSIRDGSCMDVVEIDAASETSIDDVREKIIENVQYAPTEARYKVYIIDEVHDLSAKAFDALLKTLEEPPGYVIFVLATTEWQKVPITIRSRCQPFQFKRGSLLDLGKAVQRVIEAEGCTAEPEAVQSIARSAEGSWRDALSLLEQVMAYTDKHITAEAVNRAIGTVGLTVLSKVVATLAENQWDRTLAVAAELMDSGADVRQMMTALSGHLRDLMIISAGAYSAAESEMGPDRFRAMQPQASLFDPPALLKMMSILTNAEKELRFSNQHRALLECTLLRLMPVMIGKPELSVPAANPATPSKPVLAPAANPLPPSKPVAAPAASSMPPQETTRTPAAAQTPTSAVPQSNSPSTSPATQPAGSSAESRFAEPVTFEVIQTAWPRILKAFAKISPVGNPHLSNSEVTGLDDKMVTLTFTKDFSRERIQGNQKGKSAVEKVINEVLASEGYKIRCELAVKAPPPTETSDTDSEENEVQESPSMVLDELLEDPASAVQPIDALPMPDADTSFAVSDAVHVPPASLTGTESASKPVPKEPEPLDMAPPEGPSFLEEAIDIFDGVVIPPE